MPIAGCSEHSDPKKEPVRESDESTQSCSSAARITDLTVIEGASQRGVVGQNRWATVKHATDKVIIEVTTDPDTESAWKCIQWSGDKGEPVPGYPGRRQFSRASSTVLKPTLSLNGSTKSVEIWVVSATIEIKSKGTAPANAVPFSEGVSPGKDAGPELGTIVYDAWSSSEFPGEVFVGNMGVRGKIVAVATITPAGVNKVVTGGWNFRRERISRHWVDGYPQADTALLWVNDTSQPGMLKLTPDANDRIYDTDAPNIDWGMSSSEIYHNFRQSVLWQSEQCSDYGPWYFRARWQKNRDQAKQIILKEVGPGEKQLPDTPTLH